MTLEPFHQGQIVSWLVRSGVRYKLAPFFIFSFYWGAPLALLVIWTLARSNDPFGGAASAVQAYLRDQTHLIYSVLVSLGGMAVYFVLKKTSPVIRHTLRIVKGRTDHIEWRTKFRFYQSAAFSKWIVLICGVVSISTFVILVTRIFDPRYHFWWGHISNGYSGLYFAVAASQMVFWGTWSLFVIGAVSLIISHIGRCRFRYEPLRADGCNGLRPIGLLIMVMWAYALLTSLSIYLVFSRGYLDLEDNVAIWFISLTGSVCIPLVAILPLISVTRAIRRARERYLHEIEQLSQAFKQPQSRRDIDQLNALLEVRQSVLQGNIFPFRNQAVVLFSFLNLAQILFSARELIKS